MLNLLLSAPAFPGDEGVGGWFRHAIRFGGQSADLAIVGDGRIEGRSGQAESHAVQAADGEIADPGARGQIPQLEVMDSQVVFRGKTIAVGQHAAAIHCRLGHNRRPIITGSECESDHHFAAGWQPAGRGCGPTRPEV